MNTDNFYSELPIYPFDTSVLFSNSARFTDVPEDWCVLCTDVESSSAFYEEGRWDIVNKLAAAGIDVVLRASTPRGIGIPYVYGGDGILACFPQSMLKEVSYELVKLYRYGHAVCGAKLRIGIVPVKDIVRAGFRFRIARVGSSNTISHTLFDDSAFAWIDSIIKADTTYSVSALMSDIGESRLAYDEYILPIWKKLKQAYDGEEYLCLIIMPSTQSISHLDIYNMVVEYIYSCTPRFFDSHPIVAVEHEEIFTLDFLKTDGSLKMIVSGQRTSLDKILAHLEKLEAEGLILFGHLFSKNSIITHVIKESSEYMAGLLDLDDGGYVSAAKELKKKIALKNS